MGGENTQITEDSTSILLESATFDPASIRKTAKRLGLLFVEQAQQETIGGRNFTVFLMEYAETHGINFARLFEIYNSRSEREASTKFQRQLALAPYPQPAYRTIFLGDGGLDVDKIYVSPAVLTGAAPLAPLRALAVEYVVLKGYNVESSLAALRAALDREGRLVATFTPYAAANSVATPDIAEPFLHNTDARIDPRLERPGPVIQMWQIDR